MHNKIKKTQTTLNDDEVNKEWINLLCRYGSIDKFDNLCKKSKCTRLAIMEYRKILRDSNIGNVIFEDLNTAYINNESDKLHKLFEYMFLEPITEDQFKFISEKINNKENGLQTLYDRHNEDRGTRILSVIITL